ncbi:MAG: molybdopterin-binding protein [Ahrensia sp.]
MDLPLTDPRCAGAVLAHATATAQGGRLAKGTKLTARHVDALRDAGVERIRVALLEPGDLSEDAAAARLAEGLVAGCDAIVAHGANTGRVNLFAKAPGVLMLDEAALHAFNRIDPSITVATLPAFARVDAGQMIATIKIIPFAVPAKLVEAAERLLSPESFYVSDFAQGLRCLLVQTQLPTVKVSVLDKTAQLTSQRLAAIGCVVEGEQRTAHETEALASVLRDHAAEFDLVVIFGASAVADNDDVIPAAIKRAGGTVQRVGMPVDPGNLLVIGDMGSSKVIGAPGCARSPKRNGFDWVIERWSARLPIDDDAISAMGVGGLLAEIEDRPRPRAKR